MVASSIQSWPLNSGNFVEAGGIEVSNGCHSSLYDIFIECARFDLLSSVCDMGFDNKPVVSKQQWSRLVWQQAWSIEDASYWGSVNTIMKSNDLLNTQPLPRKDDVLVQSVQHSALGLANTPFSRGSR